MTRSIAGRTRDDYAECERLLARSGSSFSSAIRILPAAKRRATTALYALCRTADDMADAAIDRPIAAAEGNFDPRTSIERLRHDLDVALAGGGDSPVVRAAADAARRYGIPPRLLRDILDGVEMDLAPRRYERFPHLEEYCSKVASAVGLAAIHIWGYRSEDAMAPGHACGVAFQLTNILRDVREDAVAGRLYLPLEDFTECDVDAGTVDGGRWPEGMTRVLGRTVGRARRFFEEAAELDPLLSTDGRLAFRAMFGTYAAIFRRIADSPERVLAGRVRLSKASLAAAAVACVALGPRMLRPWGAR